jgi:ABC-type nickel/cobalt efflux system permease component RcnA
LKSHVNNRRLRWLMFLGVVCAGGARTIWAHDVPDRTFDRAVELVIDPERIHVTFHLSLTQLTLAEELLSLVGPGGLSGAGPAERLDRYATEMGPLLARGLLVNVNGEEHDLTFVRASHRVEDHPRFQFEMETAVDFDEAAEARLALEDTNFFLEKGRLRIAIRAAPACELTHSTVPAQLDEVQTKASWEVTPEQQDAARRAEASWRIGGNAGVEGQKPNEIQLQPTASVSETGGLTSLLDQWSQGFYLLLLGLAFVFGAAHAMTPGHGKTMVAAYLVGERGTLRHAIGLGLTTSLTHTSSVLAVALLLWLIGPAIQGQIQTGFAFLSGALVAFLGACLLIVRLRGRLRQLPRAHGDCVAGESPCCAHGTDTESGRAADGPGWAGLVTLGISGGIVPCWDAVILLLIATAQGQVGQAVFLLISFSAGLAGALVLVGVLAVKFRGFLSSRIGSGRIVQTMPLLSAAAILAVGLYLCVNTLRQPSLSPHALAAPAAGRTGP